MALTSAAVDEIITSALYNEHVDLINGTTGGGEAVLLTDYSHATTPNTSIRNQHATGTALRVYKTVAAVDTDLLKVNNSSGVSAALPITNSDPTLTVTKIKRMEVNVKDFGAVGDGVTNDTAALNAMFDVLRSYTQVPGKGIRLFWPPGDYMVSTLNAHSIDNMEWVAAPASAFIWGIYQSVAGPVVDAIDCGGFTVHGVSVRSSPLPGPGTVPTVGWLFAASTFVPGTNLSNAIRLENVDGTDTFSVAQIFFSNTSDVVLTNCRPANTTSLKPSIVITNNPVTYGVTSPNRTIRTTADVTANYVISGVGANGVVIDGATNVGFFGGSIDSNGGVTGPTAEWCVNLAGINDKIGFYNTQFSAGFAPSLGVINVGTALQSNLTFDTCMVNNILTTAIPFINGVNGTVIKGLDIRGMNPHDIYTGSPKLINIADHTTPTTEVILGGYLDCAAMQIDAGASMRGVTMVRPGTITLVASGDMAGCIIIDPQGTVPNSSAIVLGQQSAIRGGNGSLSNPTFGWTSDADNGLYLATTNTPGAVAAGAEVYRWSSAGLAMQNNQPILPAAVSGTPVANALYTNNLVKGWAKFTMTATAGPTTVSITSGFNADTTVNKTGTGDYTVAWTTDIASANYMVWAISTDGLSVGITTQAAGSVRFQVRDLGNSVSDGSPSVVWVAAIGI